MKNIIKKTLFLYALLLLVSHPLLYATISSNESVIGSKRINYSLSLQKAKRKVLLISYCNNYSFSSVPLEVAMLVNYFIYGNPLQYKNQKELPEDLSGLDLSDYDFTGCDFRLTNLTNSTLRNVILTNTTCNYIDLYYERQEGGRSFGEEAYLKILSKDMKSITQVYPQLKKDEEKADLLLIASGFSRLALYKERDFYVKALYWSCVWLHWIKRSESSYKDINLLCSLKNEFNVCWPTQYTLNEKSISCNISHVNFYEYLMNIKAPYENFDEYLTNFKKGFSRYIKDASYYAEPIIKRINGLEKIYNLIECKELRQEACNIAYGFSVSYKIPESLVNYYKLFYENRIVELKNLVQQTKYNAHINQELWNF